jgi:hypothetical protein
MAGRTNVNLTLFRDIFSYLLPDSGRLLPKTRKLLYIGREATGEGILFSTKILYISSIFSTRFKVIEAKD